MGIRIALGAGQWRVRSLVMRQGIVLVAAGLVLGIGPRGGDARDRALLVLVGAGDPMTLFAVTGLLSAIALAACYLPARRAMRINPMTALRHD